MRSATLCAALALLTWPAAAQEGERPTGWQVRFDHADAPDAELVFVTMAPGWHVTTGPSCILYDPSRDARGRYHVQATIFLFPGERREGFGLFIGGQDLAGAGQAYTYFLIRKDGRYLVKRRQGSATEVLIPWTEHSAIVRHDGGDGTAKNVLAIDVGPEGVDFVVNGERVASLPRARVEPDGIVGLRVNHNLNLHVSELELERLSG